jgi:tRNA pseudouridine13 synthase
MRHAHFRLTQELPGTGGSFTPTPDDFAIEEIPLYEPGGEGEHLYVRIEKVDLTTRDVVRRAMEVFGVPEIDVGYAGLKDKHARSTQTLSLRGVDEHDAGRLESPGLHVLGAKKHRNKLRVGHLAGNRFFAVVRNSGAGAEERARAILAALSANGLPNYFGEQRFGVADGNVGAGRDVLRRGARSAGSPWKAKFLVSALQSSLFNDYLTKRAARGAFAQVQRGDVLAKVESGGIFRCTEPEIDQARYDRFEISITGPIFGVEMNAPEGEPGLWEAEALQSAELTVDDFKRVRKIAMGTRRPLRVPVRRVGTEMRGEELLLTFELPSGSYATVLLDEVVKG